MGPAVERDRPFRFTARSVLVVPSVLRTGRTYVPDIGRQIAGIDQMTSFRTTRLSTRQEKLLSTGCTGGSTPCLLDGELVNHSAGKLPPPHLIVSDRLSLFPCALLFGFTR
jgi:hypothetical protein